MRTALDWSYALLGAREQRVFARLAVFAEACTLEAVEAICNADHDLGSDILDALTTLVDVSLIHLKEGPDGEPCVTMFETIREYAREQLEAAGEMELIQARHAGYFQRLTEEGVRGS